MPSPLVVGEAPVVPLHGELRWGWELARLAADPGFLRPERQPDAPPVLLVPGFMAGDQSLSALRGWLGRRGSATEAAGIRLNVDCAERAVARIETRLRRFQEAQGRRVVVIGQSRGGELGRVLALRNPDLVSTLVMLGSPVLDPLSVGSAVLSAVRSVARLGDLGVPGVFSRQCATGDCCAGFRADLKAPLPSGLHAVAVYSRSDGIVSWEACLEPGARPVEVDSSHCGMAVNRAVYQVLVEILEEEDRQWTG
ncbi:MAG TPA: alpha/beta hydrolase [Solirubrobacteraceae bacterium]|nr:alpha/beta hydrolase [Solirubrobacteraceae bacterium]